MLFKKLLFVISLLFFVQFRLISQDFLNYSNSAKYANHLFQNKQYSLSAIEYERVLFLNPLDSIARLRIVKSYSSMNEYEKAKERLEFLFPINKADFSEDLAVEYFSILFHELQFQNAYYFLKINKAISYPEKIEYELGTLLMQYKWSEAKTFAENYLFSEQKTQNLNYLYNVALQGMDIRYKKAYSAALFSGIIPGSGKVYAKDWKDGIYAFVIVSSFSWLTYKSIKNSGLSFNSVFFGAITLSFYSANIYGSYKSALRYNKKVNERTTREVQSLLFKN